MKKGLKITGLVLGGLIVGSIAMSGGEEEKPVVKEEKPKVEEVVKEEEVKPVVKEEAPKEEEKPKEEPKEEEPQFTVSQENAITHAQQYIDTMPFSKSGLIGQLEFEGYSTEDATFAVDNIQVDWKEQTVRHAQQYMDTMPFSKQGLIDQLVFEGHSQADAEYATTQVGL